MVDDMYNVVIDPIFCGYEIANKYKSCYPLAPDVFQLQKPVPYMSKEASENSAGDDSTKNSSQMTMFEEKSTHPGYKDTQNLWKYLHTIPFE